MTKFEQRLRRLFDAQAFFNEPRLHKVISNNGIRPLSDDETDILFAAGDMFAVKEKKDDGAT